MILSKKNMTDEEILKKIKLYFSIEEFVSKKVYKKYGESAWKFLCPRFLETILVIREKLDLSMTFNNWSFGGKFSQRGLRSNLGYIFYSKFKKGRLYLSGHVLGKAGDFDVKGMTAKEFRHWIFKNKDILPFKIRIEDNVTWNHLDLIFEEKNPKVYFFNV